MQHVDFRKRQRDHQPLERGQRQEPPARVDEHPPVLESRSVSDRPRAILHHVPIVAVLDELRKRLEPSHGPDHGCSPERRGCPVGGDVQRVALVRVQPVGPRGGVVVIDRHNQLCQSQSVPAPGRAAGAPVAGARGAGASAWKYEAAVPLNGPGEEAPGGAVVRELKIGFLVDGELECSREHHGRRPVCELGWQWPNRRELPTSRAGQRLRRAEL